MTQTRPDGNYKTESKSGGHDTHFSCRQCSTVTHTMVAYWDASASLNNTEGKLNRNPILTFPPFLFQREAYEPTVQIIYYQIDYQRLSMMMCYINNFNYRETSADFQYLLKYTSCVTWPVSTLLSNWFDRHFIILDLHIPIVFY